MYKMQCPLERNIDPGNADYTRFNRLSNTTGMCLIEDSLVQCAPSQHRLLLINWHNLASTSNDLSARVPGIIKNTKVHCFVVFVATSSSTTGEK